MRGENIPNYNIGEKVDEELVLIYNAETYMDYLWVSSILEANSIKFLTKHPPLQTVYGYKFLDSFTDPIKIYVFEKDVDYVLQIINEAKRESMDYGT